MMNLKKIRISVTFLLLLTACLAAAEYPAILKKRTVPAKVSREPQTGPGYKFILLSDTHMDGAQYHPEHTNYTTPHVVMWQGKMQSMIHAAASKTDADTKFVLHAGDIMDGDKVKQPRMFIRMLEEAVGFLNAEFTSVPVIILAGNHDECHRNRKLYNDCIVQYLTSEMKRKIGSTTFYFMEEPDLFLCIDFNCPEPEIIRKALKEHANARYKFVITHGPVIPSEVWESSLFENQPEERKEFRELFLRNDVIVLSGHTHSLEYIRCETDSGRITQLITSSVWMPQLGLEPQIKISGAEKYMQLNPKLSSAGQKLLKEYKDSVTEYTVFADRKSTPGQPKIQESGAGYYILNVTPTGITADFYPGDTAGEPAWSLRLR